MPDQGLVPVERIERAILRGQEIVLTTDLATLYGVTTEAMNQAVKGNRDRFPPDFMFELRPEEKEEFHIRVGNTTRGLDSQEIVNFIQSNWNQ